MNSKVIRPEQFEAAVLDALKDYNKDVQETVVQAAKSTSRAVVSELKGSAPSGGQYARGWSHKIISKGITNYAETVYNRVYQLTHLLEKPHTTGGGGHYPKKADYTGTIAKVEDKYTDQFMEEVISKL